MTIHVVQPGDTVNSIAAKYNISATRLERDNNLSPDSTLNTGEALMITNPTKTYISKEGDTLASVAKDQGMTVMQLLQNNPQLSDIDGFPIGAGSELVISYDKTGKSIKVNGFANSYINTQVLQKTLPFLTYITILNYMVNADGSLVDIADQQVIQMAKAYGVAPLMFISSINERGQGSYAVTHNVLTNKDVQNNLIENTLSILQTKGYYGLYIGFQAILPTDLQAYVNFITDISARANQRGFEVFLSLIPSTFGYKPGVAYEGSYIRDAGQAVNDVTLITYQWTSAFIPEVAQTGYDYLRQYLDFVVTQIPPEKIFIGLTRIAYDWELPYVENETPGKFLTNFGAINLANQVDAVIQYDEPSKTPYFYYNSLAGVQHFVWFKDARTVDELINLVFEYGLKGIAVWNIMYFYIPTWLVLNSQYNIEKLLPSSI